MNLLSSFKIPPKEGRREEKHEVYEEQCCFLSTYHVPNIILGALIDYFWSIILAAVFVARQRLDIIPVQQSCFAQTEAGHMTSSWPHRWWVAEVGPELLPSPAHKVNYNECLSQTPFAHWYLALGCGVLFLGQKMVMLGSGQCRNRLVFPQHGLIELALALGRSYCGTRPACRAQHWIVLTYALDTFVFKNLLLKALC